MALRNIQVGDNLYGKTLYLNFPNNFSSAENSHDTFIASIDNQYFVSFFSSSGLNTDIYIYYATDTSSLYSMYQGAVSFNPSSYIVRNVNFIVSYIDISNPAYQYIKILDDPSSPYSVWDGSAWKVITPKVSDGTTWKNINI